MVYRDDVFTRSTTSPVAGSWYSIGRTNPGKPKRWSKAAIIATTPSSTGAKLTVGGPVVIDSATIPTLGLVPAFSIPCPQGYTRLGINKCHANSGTMETWFSSSPTGVNAAAFFTTTTVSLQNAQAKAVVIGVQCLHTNNTGSVSGTVLYTQQGGQGAIGQSSMACNGNTALNGQRTIDVAFKTVILDSSQQMNYYCRANDSAGSERECFVGILEIIQ